MDTIYFKVIALVLLFPWAALALALVGYRPLHKIGVLHEETDSPRGGFGRGGGPPLPVGPAGRAPRLRRLCKRGSLPRERSVAGGMYA